jgi:hypothetical protein
MLSAVASILAKIGDITYFPDDDEVAPFTSLTWSQDDSRPHTSTPPPGPGPATPISARYLVEAGNSVRRRSAPLRGSLSKQVGRRHPVFASSRAGADRRKLTRLVFARLRDDRAYDPAHVRCGRVVTAHRLRGDEQGPDIPDPFQSQPGRGPTGVFVCLTSRPKLGLHIYSPLFFKPSPDLALAAETSRNGYRGIPAGEVDPLIPGVREKLIHPNMWHQAWTVGVFRLVDGCRSSSKADASC